MLLFDIGANRGAWSDANAKQIDRIILVEANPRLTEMLTEKYQGQPNFVIVNKIVSSDDEAAFFICTQADTISTADPQWIRESRFSADYEWEKGPSLSTITLDQLVREFGTPEVIKIDVEGYELNVLRSLTSKVPYLSFEWAEEKKAEMIAAIRYLAALDFTDYHVQDGDEYTFRVPDSKWLALEMCVAEIEASCDVSRKSKWGMIHCR